MEFHQDKWEVISVTRKKNPTLHPYYIHGHQLKHVDHVKYLGVNITIVTSVGTNMLTLFAIKPIVLLALSDAVTHC